MANASSLSPGVSTSGSLLEMVRSTLFLSWFSMDWIYSGKAIPIYVVGFFWLVQRLAWLVERYVIPYQTEDCYAWVVPAETRHARFLPVPSRHAFRYNTLYLGVRLDQLESRKLDKGLAFAWKGGVLQPEFVDATALAHTRNVTPIGTTVNENQSNTHDWKTRMRAAERIERRRLEEKRSRNDRYPWSLTSLHPSAYLRTHIPISCANINTSDQPQMDNAMADSKPCTGMTTEKAAWISGSILLKLAYELRQRGFLSTGPQDQDTPTTGDWRKELGHVWTVTMPSMLGITGINPLTVHYCYRPHNFNTTTTCSCSCSNQSTTQQEQKQDQHKRGVFWLVVLEVHNTFSERHIYVLEAGQNEDGVKGSLDGEMKSKRRGYDHQWTFARTFHVSPFNDRGGYYRLFLKEPFAGGDKDEEEFVLGIQLVLLVHAQDDPSRLVKKLMASLDSIPRSRKNKQNNVGVGRYVRPLSSWTLYAALLRQPFDLLLTFSRILWQAAKLHFTKRLDAFGRPDMVQLSETSSASEEMSEAKRAYNGVGLPPPINCIQPHRQQQQAFANDASVGLTYPKPDWTENVAKDYVRCLFSRRVKQLQSDKGETWTVAVISTDPADSGIQITSSQAKGEKDNQRKLVFYTRSYRVYIDLMTYKPARLALLLGSVIGRRWGVNSIGDFDDFFGTSQSPTSATGDAIRKRQFDFLLDSHLRSWPHKDSQKTLKILRSYGVTLDTTWPNSTHKAVARVDEGAKVKLALWLGYLAAVVEKNAFKWLGARYVQGTEPWLELQRALTYLEAQQDSKEQTAISGPSWNTRLGSVYRASSSHD